MSEEPEISEDSSNSDQECAICLQKMELPVELPCKHKFCFLCAKGVRQKKCALCRVDFALEDIVERTAGSVSSLEERSECQWFYSAKNSTGWWLFDKKSQQEIEEAYQDPEKSQVVLSIGGYFYTCDFEKMIQYRNSHPTRHRNIKRTANEESTGSNENFTIKGIAGLKLQGRSEENSTTVQKLTDQMAALRSSDGTD